MSAATQRWTSGFDREWQQNHEQFMRDQMASRRSQRIEIADTGTATTVNTVNHALGRVPVGARILNQVTTAGIGPTHWYRETGDAEWTATQIYLRFDQSNARILLEVF